MTGQDRARALADVLTAGELAVLVQAVGTLADHVTAGQIEHYLYPLAMLLTSAQRIRAAGDGRLRIAAGKLGPGPWPSEQDPLTTQGE